MSGMLQLDPCIGYLLAIAYAVLFTRAAYLKLRDMRAFTAVVEHYQLIPQRMATPAAYFLAVSEATIAMLLLLAPQRAWAAAMGCALCLLYAFAIGINLNRGRHDLDCGCSGPLQRRPISAWMLGRNLALAAMLLSVCLPWSARVLNGLDLFTIAAGAVGSALLYAIVESLMATPAPA